MDTFPSEPSSSVLSLVKRLAGERWISVYETLLDISGEHRDGTLPSKPQNRLVDVTSELCIIGNTSDASQLKRLTESFSASGAHADALIVLLLCANIARESRRNIPQFPVAIFCPNKTSSINTPPGAFISDDIAETRLRKRELFTHFSKDDELSESRDCIADTSRCEHDSYNLWLRYNLSDPDGPISSPFPYRSTLNAPVTILDTTTEPKLESNTSSRGAVVSGLRLEKEYPDATQQDSEMRESLLHDLLHMCIAGPTLDEQNAPDASSGPTLLFKGFALAEAKPASEKSGAFTQRRRIVKQLRTWARQFRCSPNRRHIPPSRTRALLCGLVYQSVVSFGPAYLSEESSTALKAVVSYVDIQADSYVGTILKLADPASADPTMLQLIVLDTAESFSGQLRETGRVLECIEKSDGSSESILNIVSDHLRRSPCSTSLQELFLHVTGKYEKVLRDWVMEGRCVPEESITIAEFTKSKRDVTDVALNLTGRLSETQLMTSTLGQSSLFTENQALFFRRAGHGRAILRELKLDDSCPRARPSQDVCLTEEGEQKQRQSRVSSQIVNDLPARSSFTQDTTMHVFSDPLRKNCSSTQSVSNRFETPLINCFAFGEEMSIDEDTNNSHSSSEKEVSPDNVSGEFGRFNAAVHPTLYAELTISRFQKADGEVQCKIFESFVNDLELFSHLDFIRKYILLGAGDFANALVEQINSASLASESSEIFLRKRKKAALTFYGSVDAGKRDVRSLLHLEQCFRTAMYLFNAGTEKFASHLKLELSSSAADTQLSGELWDHHVDFVYEVPDPLKLIISAEAMSIYSKIHAFFLGVHRAKMSLRNLFMITRRQSVVNNMPLLSLLRNGRVKSMLWLFCMDSEQFVNTLGGFFMDQVIGSAWESFKCVWTSCESVWALRDAHRRFLEGSMQRCLLDPRQKNLRNVISGGFDIIHNVEKEITKLYESSTFVHVDLTTLQDLISSASASLRRRAVFLSDVLERLSEAGTWHATSFVAWWS